MEREKLKDWVLIFLVVSFWSFIMHVIETFLEFSFIESKLLRNIIQIGIGALLLGFLLQKVMLLFKGEEYREFLKRTRKSRYIILSILLPVIIILWIIQSVLLNPIIGFYSFLLFMLFIFGIAVVLDRKFKKEWREFKQQSG